AAGQGGRPQGRGRGGGKAARPRPPAGREPVPAVGLSEGRDEAMASVGGIPVDGGEPVKVEAGPQEAPPVEAVAGASSAEEPACLPDAAAEPADRMTDPAPGPAAP